MKNATQLHEPAAGLLPTRTKPSGRYTLVVKVPMKKGSPLLIPVHVIRGRKSGPVLLVAAGEHGAEVNGVAAIDWVFRETNPQILGGTFVGIPAINPPNVCHRGFVDGQYGSHQWDSFRSWPGDVNGTPAERIAAALTKAVIREADVVINIHAWSWYSASCAFTSFRNPQAMQLARAFGLEFVGFKYGYCKGVETKLHPKHNMLTHYALAQGKPALLVELRTHHWLYPPSVVAGINGIRNVMQTLRMLPGKPRLPGKQYEILDEEVVRAPCSGLFVPLKAMGGTVRKNEPLGYLLDLKTGRPTPVKSPCTGAIWLVSRVGKSGGVSISDMHAYADRGDMVALIKHVR